MSKIYPKFPMKMKFESRGREGWEGEGWGGAVRLIPSNPSESAPEANQERPSPEVQRSQRIKNRRGSNIDKTKQHIS